ncbi:polysialyltransferase family glycosyltransferase [Enterococcus sp. AZ072]|uniref:polysialyltransferase family glycosyltransferase n=1 Tax=unclassified Enterococcus TaxID=2608891 RepID=UPI003D2E3731
MRLAFICWTPLHIINILNVINTYYRNEKKDLYVYAEFSGAEVYYQRLKEMHVFEDVFFVKPEKMGNFFQRKFSLVTGKSKMTNILKVSYDQMFIQGENYFSKILFSSMRKKNPNIYFNYIEDGIGAYLSDQIFSTSINKQRLLNLVNPHSIFLQKAHFSYVYRPDLLMLKRDNIRRIPTIKKDSIIDEQIRFIFGVNSLDYVRKSIVYFDQPLENDGFGINEADIAEKVKQYNKLKKRFFVKLHPRNHSTKKYYKNEMLESQLPFEVLILENDFSDTILLSPLSTIAFSPLLMFDQPMKSIFLPKLLLNTYNEAIPLEKKVILGKLIDFCNAFNKVSESKVFLPETWEELERDLR